jgi:methionyl-tRNA formyltransferase
MMRAGFVTCVRLGLSCMDAIYQAGGELACVLTLHDELARAKSGRVYLDQFCRERGVPLHKVRNVNDEDAVAAIAAARLDWLFIVGWSQIAKRAVLSATRCGVLGIHPTLLPVGRGRAPIPWAILLGLRETGVTLFQLDEGVDSGPIVAQYRVPIDPRETATTLYEKVEQAHTALILESWQSLMNGRPTMREQSEAEATVWPARSPADGRLDAGMTVDSADRLVRAATRPYPGAFLPVADAVLRIWSTKPPQPGIALREQGDGPLRLQFADGWLDALEWSKEPLH